MAYTSRELADDCKLDGFSSGKPELDDWLKESSRHSASARTARTYVWIDDRSRVVAYFALCAHSLARGEIPARVGRGSPSQILIAKLALAEELQGKGLGAELVWDAASRAERASREIGARILVVDAIDEGAATFYERFAFVRCPGTLRLVQKMSSIAKALGD